jgi:hypothetical protein
LQNGTGVLTFKSHRYAYLYMGILETNSTMTTTRERVRISQYSSDLILNFHTFLPFKLLGRPLVQTIFAQGTTKPLCPHRVFQHILELHVKNLLSSTNKLRGNFSTKKQ